MLRKSSSASLSFITVVCLVGTGLVSNSSRATGSTPSTSDNPTTSRDSVVSESDEETLALAPRRKSRRSRKKEAAEKKAAEEAAAAAKAAEEEAAKKVAEEAAAKEAVAKEDAAKAAAKETKAKAQKEIDDKREAEQAQKRDAQANEEKRDALEGAGLDARIRFLSDSLARTLKRLPGDYRDQTYSVLPFEEVGDETQSRQLGKVVSSLVITNLSRDHRFALTERSQLSAIGAEQTLGQLGALDDGQAVSVGKIAAARAIIVGTIADTGSEFIVTTRALDTETARVLTSEKVSLPKEELIAFSADSVVLRSRTGAAFRSAVAPGWGQAYNREPIKAAVVGGSVGALALTAVAVAGFGALNAFSYDCWKQCSSPAPFPIDPTTIKTAEDQSNLLRGLRDTANGAYATSLVIVGVAVAVWGVGIADAYLSGVDVNSLDEASAGY